MQDLVDFHNKFVKNENYTIMVLGDKDAIDLNVLENYGKVKHLTLEDIFGY